MPTCLRSSGEAEKPQPKRDPAFTLTSEGRVSNLSRHNLLGRTEQRENHNAFAGISLRTDARKVDVRSAKVDGGNHVTRIARTH